MTDQRFKVAVMTGGHSFEVPPFRDLFAGLDGVDAYIQHLDDFCADAGRCRTWYDVACFYTMHKPGPTDDGPWYQGKRKSVLETLGRTPQGIFLLHHAILAFEDWDVWRQVSGLDAHSFRAYDHGERIGVHVADVGHPITAGLGDFEIVDETYTMAGCDADSHVLLTTDHPKSMKTLAWTRQYHKARVFCLQLGHDGQAFANPSFRTLVQRGILWCAGRI